MHINGAREVLALLPRTLSGTVQSGPIRDTFLPAAAVLLCVPEQHQQIAAQKGYEIANIHRIQLYNTSQYGDENHLGINEVAWYLAHIGVPTSQAESWQPWAIAYVEMELTEHPTGAHAQMLQQARDRMRACIDSNLKWVMKKVHPNLPGYYNPARARARVENAKAGPSNTNVENDATMHHNAKTNVVQLDYQNEKDEDTHMGPG